MRWLFVLLIAATASGQKWERHWREDTYVAIHRWISTDGDMALATSYSTGIAPRTRATGTLTLTANAGDTETVTLGGKTYTWDAAPLADIDGRVLIGGSASASLDNLIAAINLAGGAGTTYAASMTANTDATAVAGGGDTMDATAISYVTATGNAVTSEETMPGANGSWGAGTLSGATVDWIATDEVLFAGDSVEDATLNMNMDEVLVAHVTITPGYSGQIGASGNQWQIEVTSTTAGQANVFIHRGTGSVYLSGASGGFVDVILDSSNLSNALFLDGPVRNLFVKRGWCEIDGGATLTNRIHVYGSDAILSIPAAGAASTGSLDLTMEAGTVTCGRPTSTTASNKMLLRGGTWTQTGEIQTQTLIFMLGGELIYAPTADTADLPELYAISGILDLSQSTKVTQFTNHIIGPDMDIFGDFETGGFTGGTSVAIDLRETYPR